MNATVATINHIEHGRYCVPLVKESCRDWLGHIYLAIFVVTDLGIFGYNYLTNLGIFGHIGLTWAYLGISDWPGHIWGYLTGLGLFGHIWHTWAYLDIFDIPGLISLTWAYLTSSVQFWEPSGCATWYLASDVYVKISVVRMCRSRFLIHDTCEERREILELRMSSWNYKWSSLFAGDNSSKGCDDWWGWGKHKVHA